MNKPKRRAKPNGRKSITNEDRLKICQMYLEQQKMTEISKAFSVHKSTITRILQRFLETDSHKAKPKGGRVDHKKLQKDQLAILTEFYKSTEDPPTLNDVKAFCEQQFNVQMSLGTAHNTVKKVKSRLKEQETNKSNHNLP